MGEYLQLSTLFTGAGFITLLGWIVWTGPHWKARINEARRDQTTAQDRLIERLEQTCVRLEKENAECREEQKVQQKEIAELTKRVAELEGHKQGYELGEGKAMQAAHAMVVADRAERGEIGERAGEEK